MIEKTRSGHLQSVYQSAYDGSWHNLKYAFEGDDSALSTTEELNQAYVEKAWTDLGFRMKLVYAKKRMTFTGFDFLLDARGPTGIAIPEIARNIASSSWTCSSEAKAKPERVHAIGAAAMLARAENFVDYGPLSCYFAALGLAHCHRGGDRRIDEAEAVSLGIQPADSIQTRLHEVYAQARMPSDGVRQLVGIVLKKRIDKERESALLSCAFDDPCDTARAMQVLPPEMWGLEGVQKARR